eukprot:6117578-Pyramimonas_sp.AAC.1
MDSVRSEKEEIEKRRRGRRNSRNSPPSEKITNDRLLPFVRCKVGKGLSAQRRALSMYAAAPARMPQISNAPASAGLPECQVTSWSMMASVGTREP